MNALIERYVTPERRLDSHRSGHECRGQVAFRSEKRVYGERCVDLGTLQNLQSLLSLEDQRVQTPHLQRFGRGVSLTVDENLAFTDERQAEVCQRGKITGRPD